MRQDLCVLYLNMVQLRESIKLLHFQTKLFSLHKITDQFLVTYDELFDTFWESIQQGDFRIQFDSSNSLQFYLQNYRTYDDIAPLLKIVELGLKHTRQNGLDEGTTAAADNLKEALNKFNYLLTFQ